jgi:hypothetical protein
LRKMNEADTACARYEGDRAYEPRGREFLGNRRVRDRPGTAYRAERAVFAVCRRPWVVMVSVWRAVSEQIGGQAIPADFDRERLPACGHEADRNQRTQSEGNQHEAGCKRSPVTLAEAQAHLP